MTDDRDNRRRSQPLGVPIADLAASGKKPPRLQSQADRDLDSAAARAEREREHALPDFDQVEDEGTGQHEIPFAALPPEEKQRIREVRSRRPTDIRLDHIDNRLDDQHDAIRESRGDIRAVSDDVTALKVTVGKIEGNVQFLVDERKETKEREGVVFKATVQLEQERGASDIKVGEAEKLGAIEVRKEKWKLVGKVVAALAGGGLGLWKLIELIAGRL